MSASTAAPGTRRSRGTRLVLIYAIKRLGLAAAIALVAMAILFIMIQLVPGDPASIALGPRATAMVEEFRVRHGP